MRARAATVAGVLCLATSVSATGSAIINNNCPFDVYLWPVSVDSSPSSATIISSNGGSWNTPYKSASSGGWSLKLAVTDDLSSGITQFEYTLDPGTIWYDISNVNCLPFGTGVCPFEADGMVLASGSGCPVATCEAGNATCHDAYTYPDDNWASLSCDSSADTTLNLCGSSSSSSYASSLLSEASSVVSAATSVVAEALSSSSSEAPTTSTTPTSTAAPTTSTTPTPTPTTSSTTSTSTSSSSTSTSSSTSVAPVSTPTTSTTTTHHAHSHHAGGVAAAAAPSSVESSSSYVATTLATVVATTPAPVQPNVAVVYETVTQMVSTTVVYQHRMFHKERRGVGAHAHARRHAHEQ